MKNTSRFIEFGLNTHTPDPCEYANAVSRVIRDSMDADDLISVATREISRVRQADQRVAADYGIPALADSLAAQRVPFLLSRRDAPHCSGTVTALAETAEAVALEASAASVKQARGGKRNASDTLFKLAEQARALAARVRSYGVSSHDDPVGVALRAVAIKATEVAR